MRPSDDSARALKFEGTTVFTVVLSEYSLRVAVLLFEGLSADVVLGCNYIECNADATLRNQVVLFLEDDTRTPIRRIGRRIWTVPDPAEVDEQQDKNPLEFCRLIYAERRIVLPPQC